uniref:Potassium channel domain-containing protein n=1 Tax=Parascaris equorum TaxID=6256 RepID=A0A914R8L8_PAREQ
MHVRLLTVYSFSEKALRYDIWHPFCEHYKSSEQFQTFFSIGYGDVQVETYCGRALAIITGIVVSFMGIVCFARVHAAQIAHKRFILVTVYLEIEHVEGEDLF